MYLNFSISNIMGLDSWVSIIDLNTLGRPPSNKKPRKQTENKTLQ